MLALASYQRKLFEHPKLTYLFLELTDMCNLKCQHCGSGCSAENSTFLEYDVMEKVLLSVAEKYDPGKIMICLTGGEPMLHPDVYKVTACAKSLGFSVGMTSNGTLIREREARKLYQAGLDTIAISVDGIGAVHDDFRMVKGSFDSAMKGIHALTEVGFDPQAVTVIHKKNLFQLEEMYRHFRNLDLHSWRIVNIEPIGRANEDESLILDGDKLREVYDFIREKRFDNDNPMEVTCACSHFLTYEYERMVRDFYFQCAAGTQIASVAANGDIIACLDIERRHDLVQGNAYKDDFIDIWENRFEAFRHDRSEESEHCGFCEYKEVCMGDATHTWDFDKKEPRYCVCELMGGRKKG